MAEFCLDCWNELNHTCCTERDVVISREPELCEGCGRLRPVIEGWRRKKLPYGAAALFRRIYPFRNGG